MANATDALNGILGQLAVAICPVNTKQFRIELGEELSRRGLCYYPEQSGKSNVFGYKVRVPGTRNCAYLWFHTEVRPLKMDLFKLDELEKFLREGNSTPQYTEFDLPGREVALAEEMWENKVYGMFRFAKQERAINYTLRAQKWLYHSLIQENDTTELIIYPIV